MTDVPSQLPLPEVPGLSGLSVLARGGYATVYRATQESVSREVAVKVENRTLESERDQRRFLREARAAGRMSSHPHVVDLFDAGVTPDQHPYLIMEICDGSYAERMKTSPLGAVEARDVGVKIADALADAHQLGVLHRDVKPANILFSRFGEPALADFGLAILSETRDSSITLEVLTPAYAPPEMFRHSAPAPAGDVYSLSATLYALMCGRPPRWHRDRNPSLITLMDLFGEAIPALPGVPREFMDVLRAGMHNDPQARPSAEQLRDMLAALPLGTHAAPTSGAPAVTSGAPYAGTVYRTGQRSTGDPSDGPVPAAPVSGAPAAPVSGEPSPGAPVWGGSSPAGSVSGGSSSASPAWGSSSPAGSVSGGSAPAAPVSGGSSPGVPIWGGSSPAGSVSGGASPAAPVSGGSAPAGPVSGGSSPAGSVSGGASPAGPVSGAPVSGGPGSAGPPAGEFPGFSKADRGDAAPADAAGQAGGPGPMAGAGGGPMVAGGGPMGAGAGPMGAGAGPMVGAGAGGGDRVPPHYQMWPAMTPPGGHHPREGMPVAGSGFPGVRLRDDVPAEDNTPTVSTGPRAPGRLGAVRGRTRTALLIALVVLAVAAAAAAGVWYGSRHPVADPTQAPASAGLSPGPSGVGACLIEMATSGRCVTEPECFGAVAVVDGVARAENKSCTSPHTWQAFALGELPKDVSGVRHASVRKERSVRDLCSAPTLALVSTDLNLSAWKIEVLPPSPEEFAGGERTYRCLAGKGPNQLSTPLLG